MKTDGTMKRFLFSVVLLVAGLIVAPVSAQDDEAAAVVKRYEQVTGIDQLTQDEANHVMMEVVANMQGMSMPMKIIKAPGKMNIDMAVQGQPVKMIIDGDQGWMSVPGEGSVPMPEATLRQLKEQTNVSQNYLWNARDYTYAMAGEVQNGSKTYVGIRMTPRKPQPGLENLVVYFDKASGLVCYLTSEVSVAVQNGSEPQRMSVRMDLGNFKTFGKVKLPSEYRVQINNIETMTMRIKTLEYNYPTTDEMFAKPE